jgi:DNA replication and repair protein RecF
MINKVNLANFRNFRSKIFKFSPDINVIVGPNASGKTNILESIFVLSTGKSFRARIEEEMINYNHELARVGGSIVGQEEGKPVGTNLEVVLTRGEITLGANPEKTSKVARKKLLINGVSKRLVDFAGNLRTVLFGPWDLELVTEEPSKRRKFLDTVLSQVDKEYRRASLSYEKGLRQRNRLLWRIREEGVSRSQLLFWNKLLVKNGDYISRKREEFIDYANSIKPLDGQIFILEYDRSAISETRLEQYANEEVAAASTLVGPHRDDFIFKIKKPRRKNKNIRRDLAKFGSRGEQRMGVLWLKLAELSFIEKETGDKPVLLLDDIFSELDHEHREIVMQVAKGQRSFTSDGAGQTIITTADPHFVEGLPKVEKISIKV